MIYSHWSLPTRHS